MKIIQYVDDLLLASHMEDDCRTDTCHLHHCLAERGHKASPTKLQYLQREVTNLGYIIFPRTHKIAPEQVRTILGMKTPRSKCQVRALLGVLEFCLPWIPSFGELARPFVQLTVKDMTDSVVWTKSLAQVFEKIKQTLTSAPALDLPDYQKFFTFFIHENQGMGSGVLTQKFSPTLQPVAYYSIQFDPIAWVAIPSCG